ncbi:MAG: hypothetical protein ACKVJU_06085 [Verrucomicrobiales bacterium]
MPDPQNPNPEEEYRPEPVPPAQQELAEVVYNAVPPAQTEEVHQQEPVPPAEEAAPVEQVYDYTQGGDQPQVYEQPAAPIDPYANDAVQQPAVAAHEPVPVPVPAPSKTPAITRPKGAPPRRRGAQAKVATAGGGRPGSRGRPGQTQYQAPTGTGFSVMSVLMMLVALVLLILAIIVLSPSNLSDIKGYARGASSLEQKETRNLLKEAQQVMLGDEEIKFSEEEVNQYLAGRLKGTQTGAFGSMMKFKGVCVDFRPGVAEVYVERSFIGIPVTMSSRVRLNKSGNTTNWQTAGGRIGTLDLNSEKQFAPILEAFLRLAATCKEEVTVIDSMSKVKFEENMLVLDSR